MKYLTIVVIVLTAASFSSCYYVAIPPPIQINEFEHGGDASLSISASSSGLFHFQAAVALADHFAAEGTYSHAVRGIDGTEDLSLGWFARYGFGQLGAFIGGGVVRSEVHGVSEFFSRAPISDYSTMYWNVHVEFKAWKERDPCDLGLALRLTYLQTTRFEYSQIVAADASFNYSASAHLLKIEPILLLKIKMSQVAGVRVSLLNELGLAVALGTSLIRTPGFVSIGLMAEF